MGDTENAETTNKRCSQDEPDCLIISSDEEEDEPKQNGKLQYYIVAPIKNKDPISETTMEVIFKGFKVNFSSQTPAPQKILVYPPAPAKAGISINSEDYACLGKRKLLNDVIIDFYLKWFFLNKLSPEMQKKTHIFSSFFYKRLTTINKYDDPKLSEAKIRHSRVRNWTKNVDLFSKEYVIIPINIRSHWFLAIICFPGLLSVKMSDNTLVIPPKKKNRSQIRTMARCVKKIPIAVEIDEENKDRATTDTDIFDYDVYECVDETIKDENLDEPDLIDEATPRLTRSAKVDTEDPIKRPCILFFDSVAGASRSKVYKTLIKYLQVEYSLKHKGSKPDFRQCYRIRGAIPPVPQQTNGTDCGLYVLQYVEAFFSKPITNYKNLPIKMLKEWFPTDLVSRKRYEIQQIIQKLMKEQNIEFKRLNLPELNLYPDGTDSLVDHFDDGEDEGMTMNEVMSMNEKMSMNEEMSMNEGMSMDEGEIHHEKDHLYRG